MLYNIDDHYKLLAITKIIESKTQVLEATHIALFILHCDALFCFRL